MKQHIQTTLLGFSISLILSCFAVNADTTKTTVSEVKYQRYYAGEPAGQKYRRFFTTPAPEECFYNPRLKASANIDDTPEKETVVLILVDRYVKSHLYNRDWIQAFLVIAETDIRAALPKKKAFFKLFDTGTHKSDTSAKSIELQSPSFIFTQPPEDALRSGDAAFKLIDLTGDGILDIWVKFGHAVAVISFQNGEFKAVFSNYTVPGLLPDAEYVDLDKDGTYEIKVPYNIQIERVPGALHLPWMSLYEWDGNAYVLNNERFYADNGDFLIQLLSQYNYQILRQGSVINLCGTYNFYVGLASYYRGDVLRARLYLEWVVERSKKDDYIQAAELILKKLPPD